MSVVYLDDFLLIASSNQCLENVSATLKLLVLLGFLVNNQKSVLKLARSCRFLGFIFDTNNFSISIPPDKRNRLLQLTRAILNKKSCKIWLLASYIGSLISVYPVVQYDILCTKILEREKFLALSVANGDFKARMNHSQLEKICYGGERCSPRHHNVTLLNQVLFSSRFLQTPH